MKHDSRASLAYRNIGRRILGESVPLMKLDDGSGMVSKMKKFFGFR